MLVHGTIVFCCGPAKVGSFQCTLHQAAKPYAVLWQRTVHGILAVGVALGLTADGCGSDFCCYEVLIVGYGCLVWKAVQCNLMLKMSIHLPVESRTEAKHSKKPACTYHLNRCKSHSMQVMKAWLRGGFASTSWFNLASSSCMYSSDLSHTSK